MARYLVTGGCGFIGSHLADALVAAGHGVVVLDDFSTGRRENAPLAATVVTGRIEDADAVRRAMTGADGCFHLAAVASVERSRVAWAATHRTNLTGTINIFDAARSAGTGGRTIPVVYASSAAVYGDNPDLPLGEDAAARPLSAYGADKLGCELHARVAGAIHGVPTAGMRFFNVYGPRQDPRSPYSGVISIFAGRLAAGQAPTINGDGGQTRDFVYVADVVAHLRAAMTKADASGPVWNVATGRAVTIAELWRTMAATRGSTLEPVHGPAREGDIRHSLGSPARATTALGVSATTRLADGLAATLAALQPAATRGSG
ncbi:MAG: NAD-dependent epimerase/dehydratase family protein [Alphaproteobacteria bacterium]